MKRIRISTIVLIVLALAGAFLAESVRVSASPPAQDPQPTPTAKPTRDKKQKAQPTPEPAPPVPEAAEADDSTDGGPASPGAMTSQIMVFNPDSSGAAQVLIEVFNIGGTVVYSDNQTIAKRGAKIITLPASLGANFQGGAQISSDKNVQALAIGANASKTARDSYEGTRAPSLAVTLPFVRHLAAETQNSIIAIQNTTANTAHITLTLYNQNGSVAGTEMPTVAAHQVTYFNTSTLFPTPPFLGSARITSDQNVAVALQSLYMRDTSAFSGMNDDDLGTSVNLNQVQREVNSSGVATDWTEVYARNNGANPTNIEINFYSPTGALVGAKSETAVPAGGMRQFLLNDALMTDLGSNYAGWAEIHSSGEPIAVSALQVNAKGKQLYGTNGVASGQLSTKYVCGDVERTASQTSRLTLLNTDTIKKAKVQIQLYNKDTGAKLANLKVKIPTTTLRTVLLSGTEFAGAGTDFTGMAIVTSKGSAAPKILVSVSNPYGNSKPKGTTGYTCTTLG